MHGIERIALWIFVVALAGAAALHHGWLGSLEETVTAQEQRLDRPLVRASLVPGVPADLRKVWKAAKNNAQDSDLEDQLWMTLRLTSEGTSDVDQVVARISTVAIIQDIFVSSSSGETFEISPYDPPQLTNGGSGRRNATIKFGPLEVGQTNLIFVSLRPTDFGMRPYSVDDRKRWAERYPLYWNQVEVTATAGPANDELTVTTVEYGSGSSGGVIRSAEPATTTSSG
ncbi:MAG: hypothetical protein ACREDZ_09635 [Kiloniellales bacterium]